MAQAGDGQETASSGGDSAVRRGHVVQLFVAIAMVAFAVWSALQPPPEAAPRTSFTRVAGETRVETAAEAEELWRPSSSLDTVAAPASSGATTQWAAATCAVARSPVPPLRWGAAEADGPSECEAEASDAWNVYETPTTRALGMPTWATQSNEVHRHVIVVSPTGAVPALPAGKQDPRPTPQAPDVAVATVLAAHIARDLDTPTTVIVVPRYLESDRELLASLRRDGAVIEEGILVGGPRRVSDGAREVVRQLTTQAPPLSWRERLQEAQGPFQELIAAIVGLLGVAAAATSGSLLLAGRDGSGGTGLRGFLGGLLGGARFEEVVSRRRAAAVTRHDEDDEDDDDDDDDGDDGGGGGGRSTGTQQKRTPERNEDAMKIRTGNHQQPTRQVVELRVHGVHGTSPASMLGVADSEVGRVAGDDLTGIYRIKNGDPPFRDLTPDRTVGEHDDARPRVSVEAYSWGALTSGTQGFLGWLRRSLWLLLLPFALVNLAYWARTELARTSLEQRLGAWAVRAAGLLLTVFFVLTPCLLFLDLGAWQCFRYGLPSCERLPDWTDRLADLPAGRRIAAASLAPMATLLVLWLLSRTTVTRYEDVGASIAPTSAGVGEDDPGRVLRHPRLWRGRDRTRMLARRHLAAGITTVALFCAQHLLGAGRLSTVQQVAVVAVIVVGWATLVGCLVAVLGPHVDDIDADPLHAEARKQRRARAVRLDRVVVGLALLTYAATVLLLLLPQFGRSLDQDSAWVGRSFWFIAVFVAVTLLHLAVFTGGRMNLVLAMVLVGAIGAALGGLAFAESRDLYGPDDTWTVVVAAAVAAVVAVALGTWHYRLGHGSSPRAQIAKARAWNGAGASVLLAAGAWVALLFTSATVVATADWLNGADQGVGELVDSVAVERPELPAQESTGPKYEAAGDVTVDRGRVTIDAEGKVQVLSGAVSAEAVWRNAAGGLRQDLAPRVVVPSGQGRLQVAPGKLGLDDTCVRDARSRQVVRDTSRCPEGFALRSDSRVPVGDDDSPVTLKLSRGVVLQAAESSQAPLAVPPVLLWMPLAQVAWVVLVALLLLGAYVAFRRGARTQLGFPDQPPDTDVPLRDRPACEQARHRAAFAHRAERLLDLAGLVTSVVALPLVVLSLTGGAPWQDPSLAWTRGVADIGMYLVVGLSALLVGLGSRMRRSESTRKAVGVLWDLTTFWPRAAHPLAPPCYAERVVPELVQRSRWVLDEGKERRLILSGHSQGSLIVVAAASRLTDEHLARTSLVTYGSQVRALYGRVFPSVLGPRDIGYTATPGVTRLREAGPDVPTAPTPPASPAPGSLRARLLDAGGSWVNLFRRTDPLGYRVFGDTDGPLGPDWGVSADLPVPEVPPVAAGDPGPRVMGHGGYQHTLTYRRVVATWTDEQVVEDPTGTHDAPIHPPG